jgi:Ca2+-binding RTX toxin-like protein
MTTIVLGNPSTTAAENVARIKAAIVEANNQYLANSSAGQVTVQLGAGTWVVTGDRSNASAGAIELLSGVALTGSGNHGTVIKLEDNFNARLNGLVRTALENVENVTISNLVLDGNRTNNTNHQAGFISGVKADSGKTQTNITLDTVEARNFTGYGINPHEITNFLTVKNSTAHHNGLDGFVADGVVNGIYENNVSYANDRHGFNIQNASTEIILRDNTAYGNGTGATGGAGVTIQRGDIQRGTEAEIAHVTKVQIIGGEYYGNTREGILVKLSDDVTISEVNAHDNARQGVRIEGSLNTILRDSLIARNSKESIGAYDEVRILERNDYPDGNPDNDPATNPLKVYYSTGTQILNNIINPVNARYPIREEPSNQAGGATGTVITGNDTSSLGTDGNDVFVGNTSANTMAGGKGDDTYYVNHSGDVVIESAGEGNDTIISSVSFTTAKPLPANVENLILVESTIPTRASAIEGRANGLNNIVVGNNQHNRLYGLGGNDTISGGIGNDTIDGGADTDTAVFSGNFANYSITGVLANRTVASNGTNEGTDTLLNIEVLKFADGNLVGDVWIPTPAPPPPPVNTGNQVVSRNGSSRSETLTGKDNIDDIIKGQGGNDTIKGRGGNDKLHGGTGNDKVYGDSGDDRVNGDSGNDYVNAGSGNDWASGGAGNDRVYGSFGDDRVYGSSGHDTVDGGAGNDWVYGDTGNDRVYGGSGNDVVHGGAGNDRLYGGAGTDAFVFNTKLGTAATDRNVNFDTIVDFKVRDDSVFLDNAIFKKLGGGTLANPSPLDAEFFVTGTKAKERDDYLIYNKKTGVLSYDADGSGSKQAVEFAQLSKNLALTHKDFFVI